MKALLPVCFLALSVTGLAQDEQEMSTWMKTIGGNMRSLNADIQAKSSDSVAKDAKTLSETFQKVSDYFAKKNADDAVMLAKKAMSAADAVAASSSDFEKAGESAKTIGTVCGPCHMAHRERVEGGGYKIK